MSKSQKRSFLFVGIALVLGIGFLATRSGKDSEPKKEEIVQAVPAPRKAEPYDGTPRREEPEHVPSSVLPAIPDQPTDYEVAASRIFPTKLRAIGGLEGENDSVATILRKFRELPRREAFGELETWLQQNPNSRWFAALKHELMSWKYERGYFAEARTGWNELWQALKSEESPEAVAVGNEVLARLLDLSMGFSQADRLRELIADVEEQENRVLGGSIDAKALRAREAVWMIEHLGAQNVMCGPLALNCIKDSLGEPFDPPVLGTVTTDYIATGIPLSGVSDYANGHYQLDMQMARRESPASELLTPAVVHFKDEHFAAILETRNDGAEVFLEDRSQLFAGWIDRAALDEEASGYFLVAANTLPNGWRSVDNSEGRNVFGRDGAHGMDPPGETCGDETAGGNKTCNGMPTYRLHPFGASVRIDDVPLGYTPPVGPPVYFKINYNDLNDGAPVSAPAFSNVGLTWSTDWVAWIDHVPSDNIRSYTSLRVHVPGGGFRVMDRFRGGQSRPDQKSYTQVKLTGDHTWTRTFPDGSKQIFDAPDDPDDPSRVFMTQKIDPQGNALSFDYDAQMRLVSVTDAIGQVTTLQYGNPTDPHKITSVTDPFERICTLEYVGDSLAAVTDVIGLRSEFAWQSNGFIESFTTPYGTTQFALIDDYGSSLRTLEVTDPMGYKERISYADNNSGIAIAHQKDPVSAAAVQGDFQFFFADNQRLQFRNSYFWTKEAMGHHPGDYAAARNYRWFTNRSWRVTNHLEAIKEPLEERVWFNYKGQEGAGTAANGGLPSFPEKGGRPEKILRMLSDGTPQLKQRYSNALGRTTKKVDPLGRTKTYVYAENLVDLIEIRQSTSNGTVPLASFTWTPQRTLASVVDAGQQLRSFTYNSFGQILSDTNAKGETVTFTYASDGYLESIDGPLFGADDRISYGWDQFGRVNSFTSHDGYELLFEYDDLDRLVRILYPDGTSVDYMYDRMHLAEIKDRNDGVTKYECNSLNQVVSITTPGARRFELDWCRCGDIRSLVTPGNGKRTWHYDVQGRLVKRVHENGDETSFRWDPSISWVSNEINERGQELWYSYTVDGLLKQKNYPNGIDSESVTFHYDKYYPRLTKMIDGIGETVYRYHEITGLSNPGAGRLSLVDGPSANDDIRYSYDSVGLQVGRMIDNAESTVELDALGRVSRAKNSLGEFLYAYEGASNRVRLIQRPNGVDTELSYFGNSKDHRLESIIHRNADGGVLAEYEYDYSAEGEVLSWVQRDEVLGISEKWECSYNADGWLNSVDVTQGGENVRTYSWNYDLMGNMLSSNSDGILETFSYNEGSQLVKSTAAGGHSRNFYWDAEDKLIRYEDQSTGDIVEYEYLGNGLRGAEIINGERTELLWDHVSLVRKRNAADTSKVTQLEPQGELSIEAGSSSASFYSRDHLGSVRLATSSSGNIQYAAKYKPFGQISSSVGSMTVKGFADLESSISVPFLNGVYRSLNTGVGRWLSRDPMQEFDGVNMYLYVNNDPARSIDPLGLYEWDWGEAAGSTIGGWRGVTQYLGWGMLNEMTRSTAPLEKDFSEYVEGCIADLERFGPDNRNTIDCLESLSHTVPLRNRGYFNNYYVDPIIDPARNNGSREFYDMCMDEGRIDCGSPPGVPRLEELFTPGSRTDPPFGRPSRLGR